MFLNESDPKKIEMEGNNYANEDLMKLFILHGQCDQIIARTCRKFNKMFPDLQPMNKRKFVGTITK